MNLIKFARVHISCHAELYQVIMANSVLSYMEIMQTQDTGSSIDVSA